MTELNVDDVSKACGAHGWKKKSIFWDLPYWKKNLIRHNFDVTHIVKILFETFFTL